MHHSDVLCAGIIVADHVCTPIERLPAAGELITAQRMLLTIGGCAANTAVDLRKLGVPASVAGRVGGDVFGRVVTDMLRECGVDTSPIKTSADLDTSQTLIVNVAGEDRRFIHTFGANAAFSASDIPLDHLERCKVLYLGGYLVMPSVREDEIVDVFVTARRNGVRTILDVVTPGPGDYRPQFERLLQHVDVFLPNQLEAALISLEADPLRQADVFRRLGARTVVITMGGEGCVLVNDRERLRANTYPVTYVDGSGGGDAFAAGFIYGLLKGMDSADCLRVASALGASCVRAVGTTPGVFTLEECESFMRDHQLSIKPV